MITVSAYNDEILYEYLDIFERMFFSRLAEVESLKKDPEIELILKNILRLIRWLANRTVCIAEHTHYHDGDDEE